MRAGKGFNMDLSVSQYYNRMTLAFFSGVTITIIVMVLIKWMLIILVELGIIL